MAEVEAERQTKIGKEVKGTYGMAKKGLLGH